MSGVVTGVQCDVEGAAKLEKGRRRVCAGACDVSIMHAKTEFRKRGTQTLTTSRQSGAGRGQAMGNGGRFASLGDSC